MLTKEKHNKNKIQVGTPSLADANKELAKQWHPTLNGSLKAQDVNYNNRSGYFWWLCEQGHEFQDKLTNRKFNSACPKCKLYQNSLANKAPELLNEWKYEMNIDKPEEVPFDSRNKKYIWECSKGHLWHSTTRARTLGKINCPHCQSEVEGLSIIYPALAKEWAHEFNIEKLDKVETKSKKSYKWKCSKGHIWGATIISRVKGARCPECDIEENSLEKKFPELTSEWSSLGNKKKPDQVFWYSTNKYWWECKVHKTRYLQSPLEKTKKITGCPKCELEPKIIK